MYGSYMRELAKNWDEKLLLFLIACCLLLVTILFALFLAQTVPYSEALIPKRCDYNRDRYFITTQSTHSGMSILSQSNISVTVEYPFFTQPSSSLWIRDRKQIWTLDSLNGLVYISQTINSKIVFLISLGIANCGGPYSWGYNQQAYYDPIAQKLSGQVWMTCGNSNKTIVIDTKTYSIIGNIFTPPNIISTNYPSAVAVGPNYAYVVYYPNVWYAYETQPPFTVVTSGLTPGSSSAAITNVWRGNDNNNEASLYLTTSVPAVVQIPWDGHFHPIKISSIPNPAADITTSLNENFLYVIFQNNNFLYVFETDDMTKVDGSGFFSLILPKPNNIAVGRESKELIVTDYNAYSAVLLPLNSDSGKLASENPIYIYSSNGTSDCIRFVQECPCNFC